MNRTIHDFRGFFKTDRAKERILAHECIIKVVQLLDALFRKDQITITLHALDGLYVEGYLNELQQVVLSVLTNARDVFLERDIKPRHIDISYEKDKKVGRIVIRDNGGGIDKRLNPDETFKKYVTSKQGTGTGLGLHLSKVMIEERMGGKIWAHNTGGGAEYVIELPLCEKPPGNLQETS